MADALNWSNIALVFPGQGSQQVGMGADLAASSPIAAETFAEADRVLGEPLSQLCFNGPAESLDETLNTQPALFVMGVAVWRTLESQFGARGTIQPIASAGHSVGELTALAAAGALAFADGVRLVRARAEAMRSAGLANPGGMAALLGPSITEAHAICADASVETGRPVVVANDNCPGQVVISGDRTALDRALALASERGVKRAIPLAVSIAAHSPLMTHAADQFRAALDRTPFAEPRFPVLSNADGQPMTTPDHIRTALAKQLTSPVYWTACVQALQARGAGTFLELGSKDVLTGLLKRIDRSATGIALNSLAAITNFVR